MTQLLTSASIQATALEAKRSEVQRLRTELAQLQFLSQELRLQLHALGADDSVVPEKIRAGHGGLSAQFHQLRCLFDWLVKAVNLEQPMAFECDAELHIRGRLVRLRHMVSWPLLDGMRLSVPRELQEEVFGLLARLTCKTRGLGRDCGSRRGDEVEAAEIDQVEKELQKLQSTWELLSVEMTSDTKNQAAPSPAMFLVHRHREPGSASTAMVVARWPEPGVGRPPFDVERHFRRLQVARGERVEVEFEGTWFSGTLQTLLPGAWAQVQCDVDCPGIITMAPLSSLRRTGPGRPVQGQRRRSRSVG